MFISVSWLLCFTAQLYRSWSAYFVSSYFNKKTSQFSKLISSECICKTVFAISIVFPIELNPNLISPTNKVDSNVHPSHLCNTLFLGLSSDEPLVAGFQGQEHFSKYLPKKMGEHVVQQR